MLVSFAFNLALFRLDSSSPSLDVFLVDEKRSTRNPAHARRGRFHKPWSLDGRSRIVIRVLPNHEVLAERGPKTTPNGHCDKVQVKKFVTCSQRDAWDDDDCDMRHEHHEENTREGPGPRVPSGPLGLQRVGVSASANKTDAQRYGDGDPYA